MDFTRLAVDAGQFINRAVQYTGESLGQADKTPLDPGLEALLARADATKTWTDQIISQTEVLLQPNPGARFEDRLYEHLDWSVPPRPRAHEVLGDLMIQAGLEIGSSTPYGTALLKCGETQKQLGEAERQFVQSTNIHYLNPLKSFSDGEYKAIQTERRMLVNKRLDLDIAHTRLRKAHEADREARNLNANPQDDDYVAHVSYMFSFLRVKWLKMWAQEISQAEMELRICQSLFDRQSEITRRVVEGISNTHTNHMRSLTDFVEGQACYFDQCNQYAQELQKQLASIPAVLCSNNWQSEITTEGNHPSTSNHVANEPTGLNHVNPIPVEVHQIPDFDQDSWTVNPPPRPEETMSGSFVTTQPTNQTNRNNNNNTFAANGQDTSQCAASNQASDHACTPISQSLPSDQTNGATAGAGDLSLTEVSPPSEISDSSNEPQIANAVESETMATNDNAVETLGTNGMATEPETTSEPSNHLPAVNGEDVQES
ncbi:endophilin-B1-like [Cheilinus undulatus]|uniref:endophilin-B1-like n=1 Tax=Cheilinus undulatus TaxID=241271 RepID=UPI001BD6D36B|nr:endophilin-B1-like [Cheilinus undulatus]